MSILPGAEPERVGSDHEKNRVSIAIMQPVEQVSQYAAGPCYEERNPRLERLADVLTLTALITAFTIANSSLYETCWFVYHTLVSVQVGDFGIDKPLIAWINKGLMVFFFQFVGLEIKREMLEGRPAGHGALCHYSRFIYFSRGRVIDVVRLRRGGACGGKTDASERGRRCLG